MKSFKLFLFQMLLCLICANSSAQLIDQTIRISKETQYLSHLSSVDLDQDSNLDIVCYDSELRELYLFEGIGDSNFEPPKIIFQGENSYASITVEDFDLDNDLDIIVVEYNSNQLLLFENNGDLEFNDPISLIPEGSYPLFDSYRPRNIQIWDEDSDGDLDISYQIIALNKMEVLKNDGSNSYNEPTGINGNFYDLYQLIDINEDGLLDLVYENDDYVAYKENLGSSEFAEYTTLLDVGDLSSISFLKLIDVNNDQELDICFVLANPRNLYIAYSEGNLNYSDPLLVAEDILDVTSINLVDIDSDGDIDLFSGDTNYNSPSAAIFINPGSGAFTELSFNTPDPYTSSQPVFKSVFGDFNSDGTLDLVYQWSYGLGSFLGQNSSNTIFQLKDLMEEYNHEKIGFADMDGEGSDDIITLDLVNEYNFGDSKEYAIGIIKIGEGGSITYESSAIIPPVDEELTGKVGDINGDGFKDVVYATRNEWGYFLNDQQGGFYDYWYSSDNLTGYIRFIEILDMDDDGDNDVVLGLSSGNFSGSQAAIRCYLNDGELDLPSFNDYLYTSVSNPQDIVFGDVNGDQLTDIVASYKPELGDEFLDLDLILNTGESFEKNTIFTFDYIPKGLGLLDVDTDGDLDVVAQYENIEFIMNNGSEEFSQGINLNSSINCYVGPFPYNSLHVQDVNGNGVKDLIYYDDNEVKFVPHYSDGSFGPAQLLFNDFLLNSELQFYDINNDGSKDIFAKSSNYSGTTFIKILSSEYFGCLSNSANNYEINATLDDGSCCFGEVGCNDPLSLNYVSELNCQLNICYYIPGDFNGDNSVTSSDLSYFLSVFGTICPTNEFCLGDINQDGAITITDLAGFLASFQNSL